MAVTLYQSSDVGAPALMTNTAGTLIAILDACLVNGYGSKAAAGWTKPFSGTNQAVYRMATASPATGFYLNVDDSATTPARLTGYEAMTAYNTGTNPFPTAVQISGGMYIHKPTSGSGKGTWFLIADNRAFYFFHQFNTTANRWYAFFFGDIVPTLSTDVYNCLMMATSTSTTSAGANDFWSSTNNNSVVRAGHYLARDYTATVLSHNCGKVGNQNGSTYGDGGYPYPNASDSGLILDKIYVVDTPSSSTLRNVRGFLPGAYNPLNFLAGNDADTFSGKANLAGKNFLIVVPDFSSSGRLVLQTNGDWRA
jgi:hypothetical protein